MSLSEIDVVSGEQVSPLKSLSESIMYEEENDLDVTQFTDSGKHSFEARIERTVLILDTTYDHQPRLRTHLTIYPSSRVKTDFSSLRSPGCGRNLEHDVHVGVPALSELERGELRQEAEETESGREQRR